MDLKKIKLLVIDVDGTMTDSGIYYDEKGNELKKFSARDAAGLFAAHFVRIETLILTGRKSSIVEKRMKELKVSYIEQGVTNKYEYLLQFMMEKGLLKEEVGYIGDDLNDLAPMCLANWIGCPKDACEEVKNITSYISEKNGGYGAVRDCIEYLLKERGEWENAIKNIYKISGC